MSKRTMTFSTQFPAYHSRKGEPTYFVEKIWASLVDQQIMLPEYWEGWETLNQQYDFFGDAFDDMQPKNHTIRAGNRWKEGDIIMPRIWSDKPYRSKQIAFAPELEVKKVFDFKIIPTETYAWYHVNGKNMISRDFSNLCTNDGLEHNDFENWFQYKPMDGQIICWNENINYL